jgi:hypothetical protein
VEYTQLPDADWDGINPGDCIAFQVMEIVVSFKESTRPRGGVAVAFEPCVTGWKEAIVLEKNFSSQAVRLLKLKITGGYDQFEGYEAWQMEMVDSDAPDEATRWRVQCEVDACWNELQRPKFISRSLKPVLSATPQNATSAMPAKSITANRGARRAAARNQPAPAVADAHAAILAAPASGGCVHIAGVVASDAPLVQSFGVGLPSRPKRNSTK